MQNPMHFDFQRAQLGERGGAAQEEAHAPGRRPPSWPSWPASLRDLPSSIQVDSERISARTTGPVGRSQTATCVRRRRDLPERRKTRAEIKPSRSPQRCHPPDGPCKRHRASAWVSSEMDSYLGLFMTRSYLYHDCVSTWPDLNDPILVPNQDLGQDGPLVCSHSQFREPSHPQFQHFKSRHNNCPSQMESLSVFT